MKFSYLFFLLLIASASGSCVSIALYESAQRYKKGHYIVALDSVFLTDSNEVVVYYKTRQDDDTTESVKAVFDQNVSWKKKYNNKYRSVIAVKADIKGKVITKFTITDYEDDYNQRKMPNDSLDSIDYQNRMAFANNYPEGYIIKDYFVRKIPEGQTGDTLSSVTVGFTYVYKADTGIVMDDITLSMRYRVRRPHYLLLLPATAAIDAVAITAGVAVAIPIAIGWGAYELFDGKK